MKNTYVKFPQSSSSISTYYNPYNNKDKNNNNNNNNNGSDDGDSGDNNVKNYISPSLSPFERTRFKEEMSINRFFSSNNFIKKDRDDFMISRKVITLFSFIHFTFYSVYLGIILVGYGPNFIYGFRNIQQIPQNNFTDLRYSFFWVVLFVHLSRIVLYISYQWRTQIENYTFINWKFHSILVIFFLIVDVFYFFILLFYGWTCNSSNFIINPCNDNLKQYCAAYGNYYPNYCKDEDYIGLPYYELKSNIYFTIDFWFLIVFFIFDVIQYFYSITYHSTFIKATRNTIK